MTEKIAAEETKDAETREIKLPEIRSHLVIHDGFEVNFPKEMPGPWYRFWYWILLGWKWREERT